MIYNQIVTWTAFAILAMFFLEKPSFSNSHSLILPMSATISFHSLCPTTVISEAGIFLTCVGADVNETCVCVAVA